MRTIALFLAVVVTACSTETTGPAVDLSAPTNLFYELTPSGDPDSPLGVLLTWDPPSNGQALTYEVYGRTNGGAYGLRATTTSPSFHDAGIPQLQYYVLARNSANQPMGQTAAILIDERNQLESPTGLTAITMNGAIQLVWSANVVRDEGQLFSYYRVYSTPLDVARGSCTTQWVLEGTTSGEGFYVANLTNGVPLCFAVSAVSFDGHESIWSNLHIDTPRVDARNVVIYSSATRSDSSAFVFFEDGTGRTGVVGASSRADADFVVQRQSDGSLWLAPARSGVTGQLYAAGIIADLTTIDRAPFSGYQTGSFPATPGSGYVYRVVEGDGAAHYAALRVAFVAATYVVVDWSYQTAAGNADLSRIGVIR